MLANDVRWRADLKVVQLVVTGHQISVVEGYAIVCVRAEEERFGWLSSRLCRSHIRPERKNARLRKMPACLVQLNVELKGGGLVSPSISSRLSEVVDTGIRKRSTGFARQSIEHEVSSSAVGGKTRVQPLFVIDHCRNFGSRAIFSDLLRNGRHQVFTEIEMVLLGWCLYEGASYDYVSR